MVCLNYISVEVYHFGRKPSIFSHMNNSVLATVPPQKGQVKASMPECCTTAAPDVWPGSFMSACSGTVHPLIHRRNPNTRGSFHSGGRKCERVNSRGFFQLMTGKSESMTEFCVSASVCLSVPLSLFPSLASLFHMSDCWWG